jgi:hypothetical protein
VDAVFVYLTFTNLAHVKVRISKTPDEAELDGVRLDDMTPGSVREVSPSIGTWLITERYAEPEMRADRQAHQEDFLIDRDAVINARERSPRRRSRER